MKVLEFLKLCFTKPCNHQRLHSQLLGTAHEVIHFCWEAQGAAGTSTAGEPEDEEGGEAGRHA